MTVQSSDGPGLLIALCGSDGSGKTAQTKMLLDYLLSNKYDVVTTSWNSVKMVRKATKYGKKHRILKGKSYSLLHAADFFHRYDNEILPALTAGKIVLADRYVFTAYTRDVARGMDSKWLRRVYEGVRLPDVTFYLKTPVEVSLVRILNGRKSLKYYEAGLDIGWSSDPIESFQKLQTFIYNEYNNLSKEFNFFEVDTTQDKRITHCEIVRLLTPFLNKSIMDTRLKIVDK